jgi:hypothetical protein
VPAEVVANISGNHFLSMTGLQRNRTSRRRKDPRIKRRWFPDIASILGFRFGFEVYALTEGRGSHGGAKLCVSERACRSAPAAVELATAT